MKRIYPSLFALLFAVSAQAQTLTQFNHAPANGEQYNTFQCDSVGPGGSGAGTVWNFAVNTHSSIQKTVVANTVNSPTYPGANIAQGSSPNSTSYYNSSNTSLQYFGGNISIGPLVMTLNYTNAAVFASYPMSLNTASTVAISGSLAVTQPVTASGTFSGSSKTIADGTGTLIIAGMTYTDVMRTAVSQTINFTTNVTSGTLLQETYQYYSNGTKAPIVTIETSTATIPFLTTSSQTVVTRLSPPLNTVGISKNNTAEAVVSAYPNPASGEVNFNSSDKSAKVVSVYDITGQLVAETTLVDGKSKMDVSEFSKGLYIYRVNSESGKTLHTGKLTVVH